MNPELSWHQQNAARRDWKLRKQPAHIYAGFTNLKTLCGHDRPAVVVEPEHRNNPANLTCKHCKRIADRLTTETP